MLVPVKFPFHAMASNCEVQIFASSPEHAESIATEIIAEVKRVEQKYSRYLPDSVVSRINASAGSGSAINVDDETAALLDYANAAFLQSDGLFDVTSGVLRLAWDFKSKQVPSTSQLTELLELVGWRKIKWSKPSLTLSLPGMQIDFGGIGKEYAVDRAVGIGMKYSEASGLVNLGGDVRVFGKRPDGRAWSIGVAHPRKAGGVLAFLPINSGALATSGDYERFFELDGKRYCHILNPKTGWPVSELQSVSVYAESCLVAGTLATITMLKGAKLGERFLKDSKIPAMIVNADGRVSTLR